MKKIFLFIIALQVAAKLSATTYIDYNRQVTTAESLFFVGQFEAGFAKYMKIFDSYKPFAKDCFAAIQLSAMHRDTIFFNFFFAKGIENGLNWATLYKSKHVRQFLMENKGTVGHLEKIYLERRQKYLQSINRNIRDSIFLLRRRDDSGRRSTKNKMVYSNYLYYIKDTVLDANIRILERIAKRVGFPGQRMIGIRDPEIDNEKESPNLLESIASVILYHHYCGFFLMKDELYNGLLHGEILPSEYALIYEWAYDSYNESKGALRGGNTRYIFDVKCEYPPQDKFYNNFLNSFFYCRDTTLVNNCRKEIGMESIQHQLAKKKFAERNDLLLTSGIFNLY